MEVKQYLGIFCIRTNDENLYFNITIKPHTFFITSIVNTTTLRKEVKQTPITLYFSASGLITKIYISTIQLNHITCFSINVVNSTFLHKEVIQTRIALYFSASGIITKIYISTLQLNHITCFSTHIVDTTFLRKEVKQTPIGLYFSASGLIKPHNYVFNHPKCHNYPFI